MQDCCVTCGPTIARMITAGTSTARVITAGTSTARVITWRFLIQRFMRHEHMFPCATDTMKGRK